MKIVFKLREIRIRQAKTQKDISSATGISQSYISEIENGYKSPTLVTIEKLINYLNVPLNELLTIEE